MADSQTIEQFLSKWLADRVMWPDQIAAVLSTVKNDHPEMVERWDDKVSDYPEMLLPVLLIDVRTTAIDWLKANKPKSVAINILEAT
jgi:hypothetical protein